MEFKIDYHLPWKWQIKYGDLNSDRGSYVITVFNKETVIKFEI